MNLDVTHPAANRKRINSRYVVILCGLAAVGPLSIDMYLPALPMMARDLSATDATMQMSLTSYIVGLAVGILVVGPLSDSVGRRIPLIGGLTVYVAGSAICALSPSASVLIVARVLQAFGASAGIVTARAAARDLFAGTAGARVFSSLMVVHGGAPVIAPVMGSEIVRLSSWRVVFVVLAALATVLTFVVVVALPESLDRERRTPTHLSEMARTYAKLLANRNFLCYSSIFGVVFGILFIYISASPFVMQRFYGLTPSQYSMVYAVNGLAIVLIGQVNRYLVGKITERRLLASGVVVSAAGAIGVLIVGSLGLPLPILLIPLFVVSGSMGVVMPNATSLAMSDHQRHAGAAASLLAVVQLVIAGAAAAAGGLGGVNTPVSMGLAMAAFALLSLVALVTTVKHRGTTS